MGWPQNTEYNEAIQYLRQTVSDRELAQGELAVDSLGMPVFYSGNFADVYRVHCPQTGNTWAVKCFTKGPTTLRERYRCISEHLNRARLPFTVDFQFIEPGIRVRGQEYPFLKMRWVEGRNLNRFVLDYLDNPATLKLLLPMWVKLSTLLRRAQVAHADLQHGNVLLVPVPDQGSFALRLVDYDGMYVPSLSGQKSGELGHPSYQHPQRLKQGLYNGDVDRFSHLAIYSAIHMLSVGGKELWNRFDNGDNLLFREIDFRVPDQSLVLKTLWSSSNRTTRSLTGHLVLATQTALEHVPLLEDLTAGGKVRRLSENEKRQVAGLLGEGSLVSVKGTPQETPGTRAASVSGTLSDTSVAEPATPWWVDTANAAPTKTTPTPAFAEDGPIGVDASAGAASGQRPWRWLVGMAAVGAVTCLLPLLFAMFGQAPLKLVTVPQQKAVPGKRLSVKLEVEDRERWRGKLTYSLAPKPPAGAAIDAATGRFTWTPTGEQQSGDYEVQVLVACPDGRRDQTSFAISLAERLKLKPIGPLVVAAGSQVTADVSVENVNWWKGNLAYRLGANAPAGASINVKTGRLSWTPPLDYPPGNRDLDVVVLEPDGQQDQAALSIVVRGSLRLKPLAPLAVQAGTQATADVSVDDAEWWEGKLTYRLGANAPAGASINPKTGRLSWSPPFDHPPGNRELEVVVLGPDGQQDTTALSIVVRGPLKLQPIASLSVEAGAMATADLSIENAVEWVGKFSYRLGTNAPAGAAIDSRTGRFTWRVPKDQRLGAHDVALIVVGEDSQRDEQVLRVEVTAPPITVDLGGGVKLEMLLIPAGEFLMGTAGGSSDEKQHRVRITKPFYLGKYEVTQEQWQAVMGVNPSRFKDAENPVEKVNWDDCQEFCTKLSAKVGGARFQLPTEAQWEYACRAGSTGEYCFGDDESSLGEYGWYGSNSQGKTHPVGEKRPNGWGLYDMHGNVWEWCYDRYGKDYYASSPLEDPSGPSSGALRVLRGGSWSDFASVARSAFRAGFHPVSRLQNVGFRAARTP